MWQLRAFLISRDTLTVSLHALRFVQGITNAASATVWHVTHTTPATRCDAMRCTLTLVSRFSFLVSFLSLGGLLFLLLFFFEHLFWRAMKKALAVKNASFCSMQQHSATLFNLSSLRSSDAKQRKNIKSERKRRDTAKVARLSLSLSLSLGRGEGDSFFRSLSLSLFFFSPSRVGRRRYRCMHRTAPMRCSVL